jgi:hypothetical protein
MGRAEFVLILESGAGGYVAEARLEAACRVAAGLGSCGWIFRWQSGGYVRGPRQRGGRIIELVLVGTVGTPDGNALPGALIASGQRHGVTYMLTG